MRKGPLLVAAAIVGLFFLSKHSEEQTGRLPDLRGITLHHAQSKARAAGFDRLAAHDAVGGRRTPLLTSNWRVCSQTPDAGIRYINDLVTLTVVKTDENCPSSR